MVQRFALQSAVGSLQGAAAPVEKPALTHVEASVRLMQGMPEQTTPCPERLELWNVGTADGQAMVAV